MRVTNEEKDLLREIRKKKQDKKEEAEWFEQYDNCHCYDENGNWKY